uniref:LRRCT domain-containing protein n=1 Tax=Schistocephalus solidus TaxID=70667 RepID=A0A183T4G4_SCHSO
LFYAHRPLTAHQVLEEMVNQRINQGFQLCVEAVPASNSDSLGLPPHSPDRMDGGSTALPVLREPGFASAMKPLSVSTKLSLIPGRNSLLPSPGLHTEGTGTCSTELTTPTRRAGTAGIGAAGVAGGLRHRDPGTVDPGVITDSGAPSRTSIGLAGNAHHIPKIITTTPSPTNTAATSKNRNPVPSAGNPLTTPILPSTRGPPAPPSEMKLALPGCAFDGYSQYLLCTFFVFLLNVGLLTTELVNCPSGCVCSQETSALCCLFSTSSTESTQRCELPDAQPIFLQSKPDRLWLYSDSCSPQWRELTVQLTPHAWPPTRPNRTCKAQLSHLTLTGLSDSPIELMASALLGVFLPADGSSSLEYFAMENSNLVRVQPGFFDRLKVEYVTEVSVRNNRRLNSTGLGTAWLAELRRLEILDLSGNHLEEVNLALWGFPKPISSVRASRLMVLNLSNNRIKYLNRNAFIYLPYLKKLYLSGNRLSSLPASVFTNLINLEHLDLSRNTLTLYGLSIEVNASPFGNTLPALKALDLSDNPLMRGVDPSAQPLWWLSAICPINLRGLSLNRIEVSPFNQSESHIKPLPEIPWQKCPDLVVQISQTPELVCLPAYWLPKGPNGHTTQQKLITPVKSICPPPDPPNFSAITTSLPASSSTNSAVSGFLSFLGFGDSPSGESIMKSDYRLLSVCLLGLLSIVIVILTVLSIFLCCRRSRGFKRRCKGLSSENVSKQSGVFDPHKTGFYSENCPTEAHLAADQVTALLPASSAHGIVARTDSGILYNENGVPVFRLIQQTFDGQSVSGTSEMRPLWMPDGSSSYYPVSYGLSLVSLSGRGQMYAAGGPAVAASTQLVKPNNLVNSRYSLQPSDLPMDNTKGRSRRRRQGQHTVQRRAPASGAAVPVTTITAQASSLSYKSTSFSSFGGSIHSGNADQPEALNLFSGARDQTLQANSKETEGANSPDEIDDSSGVSPGDPDSPSPKSLDCIPVALPDQRITEVA